MLGPSKIDLDRIGGILICAFLYHNQQATKPVFK